MVEPTIEVVGPLHEPKRAGDAGFDLQSAETKLCYRREMTWIRTHTFVNCPLDYWYTITLRSSIARQGVLTYMPVIDGGYQGELIVAVVPMHDDLIINYGDRFAQLIFFQRVTPKIQWFLKQEEFTPSPRGANGFGSTGR